jgi:hypothetical protein
MAISETITKLSLDRYAEIMGIPATHFNQLEGNKAPLVKGCTGGQVWDQDDRNDLAWTIATAEEMIAQELGFFVAPMFVTNEQIAFNLPGIRSDWFNAPVKTQWSKIECFGTETLTLLEANATVTYSDDDNDPNGREETATIGSGIYNFLTACDNACEVVVFFRVADGAIDAADPRYEIRPLRVDIDGDTMTIKAESSLFVKPTLWDLTKQESQGSGDTLAWQIDFNTGNLVTAVDVYCRTINQQTPVTVKWDGICNCTSPCSHETQLACAQTEDFSRGHFRVRTATWNGTTHVYSVPTNNNPPESVLVNYRAGYPLDTRNCRINSQLERAVVKLTNALLPEPPCGFCDPAKNRWRTDRENVDPLTAQSANLPWDIYKQGALEAWKIVLRLAGGRGGKMGRGYR